MYLQPAEVHGLIAACARRFRGGALVFDAVPAWLTRRKPLQSPTGYRTPPWTWGMDAAEERRLAALVPRLEALAPPRGRGALHGFVLPLATRIPPLRRAMLTVFRAGFAVRSAG
jgi:hypothetical protein